MSERVPAALEHATWPLPDEGFEVAVLPWGATEAHNRHLPYGTDTIQVREVALRSATRATEQGARVVTLPAVPFGVQTGQLDIPLCLNLNPSTQFAVLRDLVESVERAGVRKLVVLNGHGGNDFKALIREFQAKTAVFLALVNWWACLDARPFFEDPGDHAGELETSVMQHLAPNLVRPLSEAGPGRARVFRLRAHREGWAWAPRPWTRVTDDTGVGDPRSATSAKGAAFVDAVVDRLAGYLVELAAVDLGDLFADA